MKKLNDFGGKFNYSLKQNKSTVEEEQVVQGSLHDLHVALS